MFRDDKGPKLRLGLDREGYGTQTNAHVEVILNGVKLLARLDQGWQLRP